MNNSDKTISESYLNPPPFSTTFPEPAKKAFIDQTEIEMRSSERQPLAPNDAASSRVSILRDCSQTLSIPGIPHLFLSRTIQMKLFWMVANLTCWGVFVFVIYTMTMKYRTYPTSVDVDIQAAHSLDFPAVTVCNLNRVQADRIGLESKFHGLTTLTRQVVWDLQKESSEKFDDASFRVNASECFSSGTNATEFLCTDYSNCIDQSRVCDGVDDCSDQSDETECNDVIDNSRTARSSSENGRDLYRDIDWENPEWYDVYQLGDTDDFRDIYPFTSMSREDVDRWSNKAEDLVLSCSFDKVTCQVQRDLHQFLDERYGRCVTFNSPMTQRTPDTMLSTFSRIPKEPDNTQATKKQKSLKTKQAGNKTKSVLENTSRTGNLFGLKLSLWLNVENYISLISHAVGATVVVHDPMVEPDLESNVITVKPGTFASIGVRKKSVTRLGQPYSDCRTEFPEKLPIPSYKRKVYAYNQQICDKYCYQMLIYEQCGCYDSFITGTSNLCDLCVSSTAECVTQVFKKISTGVLECSECTMACHDNYFETSTSTSFWPLDGYVPFFVDYVWQTTNEHSLINDWLDELIKSYKLDYIQLGDHIRKEVSRISVHFTSMNFETVTFEASYTFIQYMADIGGYMGLFVGVCAITAFEVVDWLIKLLCFFNYA